MPKSIDEVESPHLEGQVAYVALDERRVGARVAHPLPRFGQQGAVDVEPDQLDGLQAVVEHRQRDTASAADLEHLRAARQLERADHEGNLQQRLEAVARL